MGASSSQPEGSRPSRVHRSALSEFIYNATTSTSRASTSYAHCYTDYAHGWRAETTERVDVHASTCRATSHAAAVPTARPTQTISAARSTRASSVRSARPISRSTPITLPVSTLTSTSPTSSTASSYASAASSPPWSIRTMQPSTPSMRPVVPNPAEKSMVTNVQPTKITASSIVHQPISVNTAATQKAEPAISSIRPTPASTSTSTKTTAVTSANATNFSSTATNACTTNTAPVLANQPSTVAPKPISTVSAPKTAPSTSVRPTTSQVTTRAGTRAAEPVTLAPPPVATVRPNPRTTVPSKTPDPAAKQQVAIPFKPPVSSDVRNDTVRPSREDVLRALRAKKDAAQQQKKEDEDKKQKAASPPANNHVEFFSDPAVAALFPFHARWAHLDDREWELEYAAHQEELYLGFHEDGCDTPVYTLSVTDKFVCVFEPGNERFIEVNRSKWKRWGMEQGGLYLASIERDSKTGSDTLGFMTKTRGTHYRSRNNDVNSESYYRNYVLSSILLGCRVRDFEQRWVLVEQISPLVLKLPSLTGKIDMLRMRTKKGKEFKAFIKSVAESEDEKLDKLICYSSEDPLPVEVEIGSMLEIVSDRDAESRVTAVLANTYSLMKWRDVDGSAWSLLTRVYGASDQQAYPSVPRITYRIKKAKNGGIDVLNQEQAEAVARYNCVCTRAFVVEAPPGSGKTVTAAAMAVSYKGDGVQLFLSTANVPVLNMALALYKLDFGSLDVIHLISAEREDAKRSPFSARALLRHYPELREELEDLERQLNEASGPCTGDDSWIDPAWLRARIRGVYRRVLEQKYDVIFATVDTILGKLLKRHLDSHDVHQPDAIQKLLATVSRVVVDEASQLTEAALNALILSFPKAQFVLIGDSKQLPPYARGELLSDLAFRSSLEVVKNKNNIPVITLKCVYRASASLMAHYSNVFYNGSLISGKPETRRNPFSCFGTVSAGKRCLFWKVKGQQQQCGTSKVNHAEVRTLKQIIDTLQKAGYCSDSVMIISYYEAQRKLAERTLGKSFEVLTVDSAQGREKKIVIVLTTTTSVSNKDGSFFNCPLRCNVAVSRHQEALIVIGHHSVATAPNWTNILDQQYFKHVEPPLTFTSQRRTGRR